MKLRVGKLILNQDKVNMHIKVMVLLASTANTEEPV